VIGNVSGHQEVDAKYFMVLWIKEVFLMNKYKISQAGALFWLGALATAFLVLILIGIWVFRDRVFTIGNPTTPVDLIMLIGMTTALLFNVVSLFWLRKTRFKGTGKRANDSMLFGLGVLCIVMMIAEKIMADDIAHETVSGWSIQGEYLILYGMLFIQIVYNVLMGMRLFHRQQPGSPAKSYMSG
jgi:hypothetical protein